MRRHARSIPFVSALCALAVALTLAACASAARSGAFDPPLPCERCATWNEPVAPFRLFGNAFYVGPRGLASVLIVTRDGLILLDGALPQSAPLIEQNLRALGHRIEEVKLIASSHAHFDHAGGLAALSRHSGAEVLAGPGGAEALASGRAHPLDPQAGDAAASTFPPVARVRTAKDGEAFTLGEVTLTAHHAPGHTPGGTTWTWRSCEGPRCLDLVYADSLNAISSDGFRFLGDATHGDLTPAFRASIDKVAALPCDLLVTVHPELNDLWERRERGGADASPNSFIDGDACRTYAASARQRLEQRIADEGRASAP